VAVRTAIYTRISQDSSGQQLGVTRQLEDCRGLADRLGWKVVARYDDNDVSAYSGKRRLAFEAMLTAMKAAEFDAVICWHTDRLYRSMKDLERLIDVAEEKGVQLRTVQGGDLDLTTSAGRMIARILGSVARQESEHKGERHRRANQQKREAGAWRSTGRRKFGYTTGGEPLETEAAAIRGAATGVLGGQSLRSIANEWNTKGLYTTGGKPWTNLQLRRALKRPLYAGLVEHNGRIVGRGQWTALIDEDTHHGLVALLSDPARNRGSTTFETKHMGSGVYECGKCGGKLYATFPHGPGKLHYTCRDGLNHLGRLGAPLDEYIGRLVLDWLRSTDIHKLLHDHSNVDVAALHTKRKALRSRLTKLADMLDNDTIDIEQFQHLTQSTRTKLADVDTELAELARRSPLADLVAAGNTVEKRWAALSPNLRGKVVSEIMTVKVLPARKRGPGFDYDLIADGIEWHDWTGRSASSGGRVARTEVGEL
jgi:DNA invertase Pin-like site-specific DNA recombinase